MLLAIRYVHNQYTVFSKVQFITLVRLNVIHTAIDRFVNYIFCASAVLLLLCGDVQSDPGPNDDTFVDFTVCHANIRSLSPDKLRCIKSSLADSFDIIALSETFLSTKDSDRDLGIPGFHPIFRRDRTTGPGGGVALYASRCLVVNRRRDLEVPELELMWI